MYGRLTLLCTVLTLATRIILSRLSLCNMYLQIQACFIYMYYVWAFNFTLHGFYVSYMANFIQTVFIYKLSSQVHASPLGLRGAENVKTKLGDTAPDFKCYSFITKK